VQSSNTLSQLKLIVNTKELVMDGYNFEGKLKNCVHTVDFPL